MTFKNISISVATLVFSVSMLTCQNVSAQTTTDFDFTINGDNGNIDMFLEYDSTFPKGCKPSVQLLGNIYYEGETTALVRRKMGTRATSRKTSVALKLRGLPSVRLDEENNLPILTLQVRTKAKCKNQNFDIISNAVARFAVCGKGADEAAPKGFLRKLEEAFDTAVEN